MAAHAKSAALEVCVAAGLEGEAVACRYVGVSVDGGAVA